MDNRSLRVNATTATKLQDETAPDAGILARVEVRDAPKAERRKGAFFSLFPITPDGACSCQAGANCAAIGKHPNVPGWQSLTESACHGAGGRGFQTGHDIFVLDVDVSKGKPGAESLAELVKRHGQLPSTVKVKTGGGGWHYFFQMPEFFVKNSKSELGEGLDIRGTGGYVVAPGSPHRSGGMYTLAPEDDIDPAPAPQWLLDWLLENGKETGVQHRDRQTNGPDATATYDVVEDGHPEFEERCAFAAEVCKREKRYLRKQADGKNENATFVLCQKLTRGLRLPVEVAKQIFYEHYNSKLPVADRWGNESEIDHKLEQAVTIGQAIPVDEIYQAMKFANFGCKPASSDGASFLAELAGRASKPKPPRRKPNPKHEYSFTPGHDIAFGAEKKRIGPEHTTSLLCGGPGGEEWSGVFQFDEFRDEPIAINPPTKLECEKEGGVTEADCDAIVLWLEHQGFIAKSARAVRSAVIQAARSQSFHPVREYLDELPPGDPTLLDDLAAKVFGATDPLENEFLKKFLVSAVKRIKSPGCKVDTTLVLVCKQGEHKSSFVECLFGEFVNTQMPSSFKDRDASHALIGYWGIEFGEMQRYMILQNADDVKDFLSRGTDRYRTFNWGGRERRKRQCVCIGTTNDTDFLVDPTGARRFWPIEVRSKIDIEKLTAMRDSIWAAAVALEKSGYEHWFENENDPALLQLKAKYQQEDAWHGAVAKYLQGKATVSCSQVYLDAVLRGDTAKVDSMNDVGRKRVQACLRRLGCTPDQRRIDGVSQRVWDVPVELASLPSEVKGALSGLSN